MQSPPFMVGERSKMRERVFLKRRTDQGRIESFSTPTRVLGAHGKHHFTNSVRGSRSPRQSSFGITGALFTIIQRIGCPTSGVAQRPLREAKLMAYRAETPSELLVCIRVILAEIPRETLNAVFLKWMERLQKRVQVNGEYVE
jgi:hypothetical protein